MPEVQPKIIDYTEVNLGKDGLWYVSACSDNGNKILTSEGYNNMHYALKLAAEIAPVKTKDS